MLSRVFRKTYVLYVLPREGISKQIVISPAVYRPENPVFFVFPALMLWHPLLSIKELIETLLTVKTVGTPVFFGGQHELISLKHPEVRFLLCLECLIGFNHRSSTLIFRVLVLERPRLFLCR